MTPIRPQGKCIIKIRVVCGQDEIPCRSISAANLKAGDLAALGIDCAVIQFADIVNDHGYVLSRTCLYERRYKGCSEGL